MDDFFIRALVAGTGVALVAGPLGCYVVWRRLAYFGDTLSHAGLLGVALALLFEVNTTLTVFAVSIFISMALLVILIIQCNYAFYMMCVRKHIYGLNHTYNIIIIY